MATFLLLQGGCFGKVPLCLNHTTEKLSSGCTYTFVPPVKLSCGYNVLHLFFISDSNVLSRSFFLYSDHAVLRFHVISQHDSILLSICEVSFSDLCLITILFGAP